METSPTLIINQTPIHHLSGPVSYRFLEPKNFDRYHTIGLDLPLILLFGDNHTGFDNMCSIDGPEEKDATLPVIANALPCDKAKGCYRIYDREFISLCNELAEHSTYPIDFYSELHNKHQDFYLQRNERNTKSILDLINVRSIYCLSPSYRHVCPYPHLRWNYADVRSHQNGVISDLQQFGHNIFKYKQTLHAETIYNHIEESRRGRLIDVLNHIRFSESFDVSHMYNVLFDYIQEDETDKIRKQIHSQTIVPFNNMEFWKDILIRCVNDSIQKRETPVSPARVTSFIQTLTNSRGMITLSDEEREIINILSYFITIIVGPFMDLYFILRIFKTPTPRNGVKPTLKNSSNPTLAIGYFGHNHCTRISYMLSSVMNLYKIRETELPPTPTPIRCLHLSGRPIDIDVAVFKHNARRAPPGLAVQTSYQEASFGYKTKNRYLRYFR
jgi:hypothetical protein